VSAAYADPRITGAAATGSAVVGREDRWSDIDLAWCLAAEVDLAFWPAAEFGAIAPTFRLLFGTANERPTPPAPAATELIGPRWLYALHARSSIARSRVWQAEYMISSVRDPVLALMCTSPVSAEPASRGLLPRHPACHPLPTSARTLRPR
jgi:hypothetical protein